MSNILLVLAGKMSSCTTQERLTTESKKKLHEMYQETSFGRTTQRMLHGTVLCFKIPRAQPASVAFCCIVLAERLLQIDAGRKFHLGFSRVNDADQAHPRAKESNSRTHCWRVRMLMKFGEHLALSSKCWALQLLQFSYSDPFIPIQTVANHKTPKTTRLKDRSNLGANHSG